MNRERIPSLQLDICNYQPNKYSNSMGESNTIVNTYTMYRHLH